jgi:adenosine deaminase
LEVFTRAKQLGFMAVAHAGEEGPASYIWEALKLLEVSRVDHGNRALEDPALVSYLAERRMPLTVCPLSNLKLCVVKDMRDHPLRNLMEKGLVVTVNSDDPAYFGGYLNENYYAVQLALGLSKHEVIQLAENSFLASFISEVERTCLIQRLHQYVNTFAE